MSYKILTVRIPEDLMKRMRKHRDVNWSEIVRRSIEEHLKKLEEMERIVSSKDLIRELDIEDTNLKWMGEKEELEFYKKVMERRWKRINYLIQAL